jgi:hypothetical protein
MDYHSGRSSGRSGRRNTFFAKIMPQKLGLFN